MGFNNPEITWHELERRLSGRPAEGSSRPEHVAAPWQQVVNGDGGDSPAWSRKRPSYSPAEVSRAGSAVPYGELHAHSSFSFLDGASGPEELAEEAVRLGLESLTLTDHDGVYGVVRFAEAAEAYGLATGFGAELALDVALPSTQAERSIAARVGVPDPP
ncbi:MAG TPA: PHP domain-containing protein, partial [Mycobacterium sp.]|nr:PHP domain-containing protein [Mycobacterium sp.]